MESSGHWEQYQSYNTTDDALALSQMADDLASFVIDEDDSLGPMSDALRGISQRLVRLDTTYPYPDPIPEHWGPKPDGLED